MRKIQLHQQAFDDMQFWLANDTKLLRKIFELLESTCRTPFQGIGKPEALNGDLRGFWSRRITDEHRIVYGVTQDLIIVLSCRSHYRK